jgi:hypothetical protein
MDTQQAQEQVVQREARALRETLRLFEQAATDGGKEHIVPNEPLRLQGHQLERLIERPEATPEARKMLQSSVALAEQIARRLQAPPRPPLIQRILGPARPTREALADTAKLGKALQEELEQHRKVIEQLG